MRRARIAACWLAVMLLWIVAACEWPPLPARLPVHFDASGRPNAFADKSLQAWFLLPLVATALNMGLALLMPVLSLLALKHPGFMNMPDKSRWLQLDPQARMRTLRPAETLFRNLQLLISAMSCYLIIGMANVAAGQWRALPVWPALILVGVMLGSVLWMLAASLRAVAKETKDSSLRA